MVRPRDLLHILLFIAAVLPAAVYRIAHGPFWLISECRDEARDNAYWFFRYISMNGCPITAVYAVSRKSPDWEKVAELGKTVRYGGLMHWILYLACDIRISTHKAGTPNSAVCRVLEDCRIVRKKTVFLQHGVVKDDLPYVHAENARFSMFVTTAPREHEYVTRNFGYPPGVVVRTGLCRFDDLKDESDGSLILIMPTWRQWIASPESADEKAERFLDFRETEYFRMWNCLINSPALEELLSATGKHVVFYQHRNMQKFTGAFLTRNADVRTASFPEDAHELLKKAAVLVTDYSSVAMDFAYMGKPVVYYQFDYRKFRDSHLSEGYYDYRKDGFGPVEKTACGVISDIGNIICGGMRPEHVYRERMENFFDMRDGRNCERTYRAVMELSNKTGRRMDND